MFELNHIRFAYGSKTVVDDINLRFERGHFYGVIGPNGCGKSTLIDLLAGHLNTNCGEIRLNETPLSTYSRKELSSQISIVPQDFRINFPYTCQEIVMMGRYPYIPKFAQPDRRDWAVVDRVIHETDLTGFETRFVNQLSGGERQRVVFARCLAQETPVLLLDEATSNLDMHHTLTLLNLASRRVLENSLVISVMQDINLAAMYCDRLVCMRDGKVFASGPVEEVLSARTLQSVFHVDVNVEKNDFSGNLQVTFKKEMSH